MAPLFFSLSWFFPLFASPSRSAASLEAKRPQSERQRGAKAKRQHSERQRVAEAKRPQSDREIKRVHLHHFAESKAEEGIETLVNKKSLHGGIGRHTTLKKLSDMYRVTVQVRLEAFFPNDNRLYLNLRNDSTNVRSRCSFWTSCSKMEPTNGSIYLWTKKWYPYY